MKSFYFIALFCGLFLLHPTNSHSQSWQWGRSTKNLPSRTGSFINNIATDPNGNLYTVSVAANIDIPWYFRAGYATKNLCIISYDCAGNFRWGKMIELQEGDIQQIRTDELGGVYISAILTTHTKALKIDEDAIIPASTKQFLYVKFDTSGNFKWYRMPELDSVEPYKFSYSSYMMDVDPAGNMRMFAIMNKGAFFDSNYIVTDTPYSAHIVGYDANGNFNFGVPLKIKNNNNTTSIFHHSMAWDKSNDKFYILQTDVSNKDTLFYGAVPITNKNFVLAKFDNAGHNEWVKTGTEAISSYSNQFSNVISDEDGSIFLNCRTGVGDSFDGYTFSNETGKGPTTAILKYDKNGNRVWVANTKVEGKFIGAFSFALSNNILAAFAPLAGDTFVRWELGYEVGKSFNATIFTDSFNLGSYFVRFDATTGKVLNVDSILGARITPSNICGNAKGGFYIAGMMDGFIQKLLIPGGDTIKGINTFGLNSPFLLKYGTNDCGITTVPEILVNKADLKLYPNPSGDFIFIENACPKSQIKIYNTMGQLVSQRIISDATTRIDVQQLPTGIYIIELTDKNNQKQRLKLMKQ